MRRVGKPDQIRQHKIQLLSFISQKPFLILINTSSEELIGILECGSHIRLMLFVCHKLMHGKLIINNVDRNTVFFTQCLGNRSLSAACGS